MIPRSMKQTAVKMASWFPVVSITGPRQSGKSTLVRDAFPDYEYVNLENPDTRNAAVADPVGFIRERPHRMIVDEAQMAPDLFNTIQVASDENGNPGQYVLSGSQNFLLLKNISQSLAGRVGVLRLMPLSFAEARSANNAESVDGFMLRGGYPRLHDIDMPARIFYDSYISTYLERDVAGYLDVRNVRQFETFMRLLAQTAGNLLNMTRLAADAGVSVKTARSWMSILESSYIVFRLQPFHSNLRKRLVKTPKVYFYDTGLLCHLLGIHDANQLRDSQTRGVVFENLIVEETLKRHYNEGIEPDTCFYRDASGHEANIVDLTNEPEVAEVKASMTFRGPYGTLVDEIADIVGAGPDGRFVVMRRDEATRVGDVRVVPAEDWLLRGQVEQET